MNAAFFINTHNMTAAEFLPSNDDPKLILDKLENIENVKKLMPTVIPLMLKKKGFASLYSLLHRTASPERYVRMTFICFIIMILILTYSYVEIQLL